MSIHLMTLAWQTALPLNQKAALLALADWANDRGGSIHPSIYTISERLTCSERTAQRLMRELTEQGWIAPTGNAFGGARGATRKYCINVPKLREQAAIEEARREAERAARWSKVDQEDDSEFPLFQTGVNLSPVTTTTPRGDTAGIVGVTPEVVRGDTGVTQTTIEPPIEPPENHSTPAAAQSGTALVVGKPPKAPKEPLTEEQTAHKAACGDTWLAYCLAYEQRYGVAPVRNAPVNAQIKQLVLRLGQQEAPGVARFYVEQVHERFVVQQLHPLYLLLRSAEAYRTQWVRGQAMTSTRAAQADKTAANYNTVDEAMAILAARDERGRDAYR